MHTDHIVRYSDSQSEHAETQIVHVKLVHRENAEHIIVHAEHMIVRAENVIVQAEHVIGHAKNIKVRAVHIARRIHSARRTRMHVAHRTRVHIARRTRRTVKNQDFACTVLCY